MKISVVIPAYNAEPFLAATVESVLSQSLPATEIIVVNDGSTDRTDEIARSFLPRIQYIRQNNQGLSSARNRGIHAATGDWIALLDSDDLMTVDKLAKQAKVIESSAKLVLVYTGFTYLYPDGSTKDIPVFPATELWPALRYRTPILPSTTLIRRSALLEVGGFRTVPTEDWDMWFRLMRRYSADSFASIPESLLLYRQWENSLSKRYMCMARGSLQTLDNLLLDGLSGLSKSLWKRRIEAKIYYNVAVAMRENQDGRFWAYAIQSFLSWPLAGKVMPQGRYKVFAHMLYRRFMDFRPNFRFWWPRRNCRREIEQSP